MAELQKREKIMLGATGGLVVTFLLYQFVFTKVDAPPPQAATRKIAARSLPTGVEHKVSEGEMPAKTIAAEASYSSMDLKSWGRDPFHEAYRLAVFDTSQMDSSRQLVLKGIIWKGSRALVLINDSILRKGEKMGDLKILDIKKERVICKQGNNLVTLFLDDEK